MTVNNNKKQYAKLRKEFPFFEYQSYSFILNNDNIEAEFCFNLADKYIFKPTINIPIRSFYNVSKLNKSELNNYIFHIGMVELVSYWKVACAPKVIIKPHNLDEKQISWWKKLYFHGLGEFFFLLNIPTG